MILRNCAQIYKKLKPQIIIYQISFNINPSNIIQSLVLVVLEFQALLLALKDIFRHLKAFSRYAERTTIETLERAQAHTTNYCDLKDIAQQVL